MMALHHQHIYYCILVIYPISTAHLFCYVTYVRILGIDYGVGPYSVTFPAGSTRTLLDISINDDDIVEGIENFTLIIDPSSPLSNVTIGHYNQTTVTILDNDCKFCINVCTV